MTQPETATERTAVIMLDLARGKKVTIRHVMERANLGRSGAYALMARISRVRALQLYNEEYTLLEIPRPVDGDGVG